MKTSSTTIAACATALSAVLIAGAGAPAAHAATAIGVNGIGGGKIGNTLRGWVWEGSDQQLDLGYADTPLGMDTSIKSGVRALVALMGRTPDVDRLIGMSQSALVIISALRDHPEIVPANGLTVYLIGNPGRARTGISDRYEGGFVPIVGLTHQGPIPEGIPGLTVIDVSFEYDGIADSPNPFNVLAVLNAIIGAAVLHPFYGDVDMSDPNLLVRQIGSTTQYLVPVKRLPILSPLYGLGLAALADALDPLLRAIIDSAHDRQGYVTQGSLPQSNAAQFAGAATVPESVQASLRGELRAGASGRLTALRPTDQATIPDQPAAVETATDDAPAAETPAEEPSDVTSPGEGQDELASGPPRNERAATRLTDRNTDSGRPGRADRANAPRKAAQSAERPARATTDTATAGTS